MANLAIGGASPPCRLLVRYKITTFAPPLTRTSAGGRDVLPLRLFYGSYYRGNSSLRPGWLRSLHNLCSETVPSLTGPGRLRYGDLSHPDTGRLLSFTMERTGPIGTSFGGVGVEESNTAPLSAFSRYFAADPQFAVLNVPLEQTVVCPTEQAITEVLENYLGWQVRHGYVDQTVYDAYAQCFGQQVDPARRVQGPGTGISIVVPSLLPLPPKPALPSETKKTRLVDDLDEPTVAIAPPPAVAPSSLAPPVPTVSPVRVQSEEQLDPANASMAAMLTALRTAKKAPDIAGKFPIADICRQLLFRFSDKLQIADFDLIDSFSS